MQPVILALAALLLFSALTAAAWTALFSVGSSRVRTLQEEGFRGADALAEIRESRGLYQGSLLLLSSLSGLLTVGVASGWGALRHGGTGLFLGVFLSVLAVLLLGQLLPRALAGRRPVTLALWLAPPVRLVLRWLGPLLRPFARFEQYLVRAGEEEEATAEEREVRELALLGRKEGLVALEEHELVERAFRLDELTAWDIMTPRVAIFAWPDSLTLGEIVDQLEAVPYSRVPVYGESIDDVTGILHVREAYAALVAGKGSVTLKEIAWDPYFLPGSLSLTRLLKDFQARRIHLGIVADEFGGTDGLVTLEDILEELVGEIRDETDLPEEPLIRISKNEIIADGALDLREINHAFKVSLPQSEHRSLNGFIIEELGYVPEKGEVLERHGVRIDVVEASETQVLRARLRKLAPPRERGED